jgi:hypothetical protein
LPSLPSCSPLFPTNTFGIRWQCAEWWLHLCYLLLFPSRFFVVPPSIKAKKFPGASHLLTSRSLHECVLLDPIKSSVSSRCPPSFAMPPSSSFKSAWTQFFPPKPRFTEKDIPADLQGKVYMATGANCGMGLELARILYAQNAKVYLACHSADKAAIAISSIKTSAPKSTGQLVFLPLDLADLRKVKAAAQSFLTQESMLHVLFNNAGVMVGRLSLRSRRCKVMNLL